jgi:hypothetical protein
MRHIQFLAIVMMSLITLSSCSKRLTPFTENIYEEFNWTDRELEKIQFYLSDDIILHRKLRAEDSKIDDGKIRVVDGSRVEEIVFKRGTPGVFMFTPKKNRMAISFESGGEEKYLMFGPNSKTGGKFVLLAKEWNQRSGKVSYNSKTYTTSYESAYANLLVDLKKARNINYKSRTAKGRTVDRK